MNCFKFKMVIWIVLVLFTIMFTACKINGDSDGSDSVDAGGGNDNPSANDTIFIGEQEYTITQLDWLGNHDITRATGINDKGQIVGSSAGEWAMFSYIYENDNFRNFLGNSSGASGINNLSQIVGKYSDNCIDQLTDPIMNECYKWDDTTRKLDVIRVTENGEWNLEETCFIYFSSALDINDQGQIVGLFRDVNEKRYGFLIEDQSYTVIDIPVAYYISAHGINNMGDIVGYYLDTDGSHGFLWQRGEVTVIDFPDAINTRMYGINDDGSIVGAYEDDEDVWHGFLFFNDSFEVIDIPDATYTRASDINNLGQIVGFFGIPNKTSGFLLTPVQN